MLWEVRIDARETVKRVKPLLSSVHCDCDGVTLPACLSACIKAHKATRRRKSNRNEFESIWQAEIIPFTFNPISTYINVNKIKFSANELHDNKYTHSEPCNSDFGVFANIILFITIFVHLFFLTFCIRTLNMCQMQKYSNVVKIHLPKHPFFSRLLLSNFKRAHVWKLSIRLSKF